jgi:hypothetical protein
MSMYYADPMTGELQTSEDTLSLSNLCEISMEPCPERDPFAEPGDWCLPCEQANMACTFAFFAGLSEGRAERLEKVVPWNPEPQTEEQNKDATALMIAAALPKSAQDFQRYKTATELVSTRVSQPDLIALTNWLLTRAEDAEAKAEELETEVAVMKREILDLHREVKAERVHLAEVVKTTIQNYGAPEEISKDLHSMFFGGPITFAAKKLAKQLQEAKAQHDHTVKFNAELMMENKKLATREYELRKVVDYAKAALKSLLHMPIGPEVNHQINEALYTLTAYNPPEKFEINWGQE